MQGLKSRGGRSSDIGTQHLPEPADQLALCLNAGDRVDQFDLTVWWVDKGEGISQNIL